ncbi:MAG: hypothetical protein FJ313_02845 [Gemmatimonadetes bacterium]|nr:hypothetical protein [Gemmatimonadota bacterium]
MPKRGSRRLAQKASTRSRKRRSRPNIFIADTDVAPEESRDTGPTPAPAETPAPEAAVPLPLAGRPARSTPTFRAARGQPARSRSEVFTHYLPQELRKLAILSAAMLVTLIVLTIFMR